MLTLVYAVHDHPWQFQGVDGFHFSLDSGVEASAAARDLQIFDPEGLGVKSLNCQPESEPQTTVNLHAARPSTVSAHRGRPL